MPNKIQLTTIFTRPNRKIEFYKLGTDFQNYIDETYIKTGKILSKEVYISGDKMSKTTITHYASREAYEEFNSDPIHIDAIISRNLLCKNNNIKISRLIQEYNDDGIVSSISKEIIN
jgi:hypothetical protein